jgi:hypothetical protein
MCVLISGQASIGPFASPVFACAGKTELLAADYPCFTDCTSDKVCRHHGLLTGWSGFSLHKVGVFWMFSFGLVPCVQLICGKVDRSSVRSRSASAFSEDFPMTIKTIAKLLILSAFATTGANSASAQGSGSGGGAFHGGGGGNFHGRSSHGSGFDGREFHGRGFVGYGFVDGNGYGNDNGYADWYGISPGYDECPLFRQRVMTRDGWRVRMIPIC